MTNLQEIKLQIDKLTPDQQLELADYATSKGTATKQSAEKLVLLSSLTTPVTDSDKAFIANNKHNKDILRYKIKFTETTIELDGLKFPRTIVKYEDIINTSWLKLNTNVYQNNGYDYFTLDALRKLGKAWYKVPSKDQRQQAADLFGWDYWLLWQLLNYPKAGVRRSNGSRGDVGIVSHLWSSTIHVFNGSGDVWFSVDGHGGQIWNDQYPASSLVFLQD